MKTTLVLGGPGTGKTHRLLSMIEEELYNGTIPERIAFVSFTRKAVEEAKSRAIERLGLAPDKLPLFRTLHSLCYSRLGIRQGETMGWRHLRELGKILGVALTGGTDEDMGTAPLGDRMLFIVGLSRAKGIPLEQAWHECRDLVAWHRLLQFAKTLEAYKEQRKLVDFADMLAQFKETGEDVGADVVFIDEAQDLTRAQWLVANVAFSNCKRKVIAGDDDQAIYAWSGADIEGFLSLAYDKVENIQQSRRVPKVVHFFAQGLLARIHSRYQKQWTAKAGEGTVQTCLGPSAVDLRKGTWYLLARNRCFLAPLIEECERQGVAYSTSNGSSVDTKEVHAIMAYERIRGGRPGVTQVGAAALASFMSKGYKGVAEINAASQPWFEALDKLPPHKRSYYQAILRSGEKLLAEPRVHVDTIHGVKGGEAENVLLSTDQTARTEQEAIHKPDDEARVFYVGATRASSQLWLMSPQTMRSYRFGSV